MPWHPHPTPHKINNKKQTKEPFYAPLPPKKHNNNKQTKQKNTTTKNKQKKKTFLCPPPPPHPPEKRRKQSTTTTTNKNNTTILKTFVMPNILISGSIHLCKSATVSPTSCPHVNRAPQEEAKSTHHFLSPGFASGWKLTGSRVGTQHHIGWKVEDFFIFAFVLIIAVCPPIEADFLLQKNNERIIFFFDWKSIRNCLCTQIFIEFVVMLLLCLERVGGWGKGRGRDRAYFRTKTVSMLRSCFAW